MTETRYTPDGVRMRRHSRNPGKFNWLLLPGGPGIGSESLRELADAMTVPGSIWLVDLPGDGSNTVRGRADPYASWPHILLQAAQAVANPVFVGHSTGGMYLLATPPVEDLVCGLALLDTAPDCSWHSEYLEMTRRNPLPAFERAAREYSQHKTVENLAALAVASAAWNFTPAALGTGEALLARMPYNSAAAQWSDAHFDHTYQALWWPLHVPVLRMWGEEDRIVSQRAWAAQRFQTPNVIHRAIPAAGHFPWIDNPDAVARAFTEFAARVSPRVSPGPAPHADR